MNPTDIIPNCIAGLIIIFIVAMFVVGFKFTMEHGFGNIHNMDIIKNKHTFQLNDTTFKTYSCIRIQTVIK